MQTQQEASIMWCNLFNPTAPWNNRHIRTSIHIIICAFSQGREDEQYRYWRLFPRFRENQTCTKSQLPFCVALALFFLKGKWAFSGTRKPPFLWEFYYFCRISCMNPLFSPTRKLGAKGDARWWTSFRCMFDSLWQICLGQLPTKKNLVDFGGPNPAVMKVATSHDVFTFEISTLGITRSLMRC